MRRFPRIWLAVAMTGLILGATNLSQATILRVAPNGTGGFLTLNAAYAASTNGDTIVVSPGTYNENVTVARQIHWIGAGYDRVFSNTFTYNNGSAGSVLEGFRLSGSYAYTVTLNSGANNITIRRCYLFATGAPHAAVYATSSAGLTIIEDCHIDAVGAGGQGSRAVYSGDSCIVRNCLIDLNNVGSTSHTFEGAPDWFRVENCTIIGAGQMFGFTGTFAFAFVNNLVWDWWYNGCCGNWGTYPLSNVIEYNACQEVVTNFSPGPIGTNAVTLTTNPFVNYDGTAGTEFPTGGLHLAPGCPAIDAGSPGSHDLDGSATDIGAYGNTSPFIDGGSPAFPTVIDLQVSSSVSLGDSINVQSTGRIGPRY